MHELGLHQERERNGERERVIVAPRVHQRVEEVVPRVEELEQRHRGDARLRQGDHHSGQHLELVGAVDAGGVGELLGDGEEELAEQEDVEGGAQELWDDQRLESVDPAQQLEDAEHRDHRHLARQHHRRHDQQEQRLSPPPADFIDVGFRFGSESEAHNYLYFFMDCLDHMRYL